MDELKPCPCCQGEAELSTHSWEADYCLYRYECFASCQECGLKTPLCSSPERARAIWNRRTADAAKEKLLGALTALPDTIIDHCCGRCPNLTKCAEPEFKPECGIARVMERANEVRNELAGALADEGEAPCVS